jgi:L-threonylcarbamoyladenylate synthase
MPANKVALRLIKKAKVPVVAPSANLSGSPPPRSASDVLDQLGGKIDAVLDAGPTEIGTESTVVDMTSDPPKILREGAISRKEIIETLNSKP